MRLLPFRAPCRTWKIIFLLFNCLSATQAQQVIEITPLTRSILVVQLDEGYIRYHLKGERRDNEQVFRTPLDVPKAILPSTYTLSSIDDPAYSAALSPDSIGRKSKGTEYSWLCQSYLDGCINTDPDYVPEHWLYLFLPHPLQTGKQYTIALGGLVTGSNTFSFTFDEKQLRSDAVHVNNIGYSTLSDAKYAYLHHWMGDKGGLDLSYFNGNPFQLVDQSSGQAAFTGSINFRKGAGNAETGQNNETPQNNFSASDVYECNFSSFNTPGQYKLVVEGMGSSFPFFIQPDAYREAFYWTMKGLYQNRSGIALTAPFTDKPRPAPHHLALTPGFSGRPKYTTTRAFDLSSYDGTEADKGKVEAGFKGTLDSVWGWYQDAGDWDTYYTHSHIPAYLMLLYEAARDKFTDNELSIPESGNGIPDLLDEAAWQLRFYKRAKDEIRRKGWGRGGVPGSRVFGDLWGGDTRVDGTTKGSWEDTDRDWYVTGEDPWISFKYAALAAQMGYILESEKLQDPQGVNWRQEAIEAFEWARTHVNNGDEQTKFDVELDMIRTYAAAALYRLTARADYRLIFEQGLLALDVEGIGSRPDALFAAAVYLLMPSNRPVNSEIRNRIIGEIKGLCFQVLLDPVEKRAARWGGNFYFPLLIGHQTTPMVIPGIVGMLAAKDNEPVLAASYKRNMFTTADYFLGTNPLGMTWISGVGERHPTGIFHLDWWYSGRSEVIKGVVPYGTFRVQDNGPLGPWNHNFAYRDKAGNAKIYPASIDAWPGHERWFNQRTSPLTAEFTVHQTNAVAAAVYGFLSADKISKTVYPVAEQQEQIPVEVKDIVLYPNPSAGRLTILKPEAMMVKELSVYNIQGKLVARRTLAGTAPFSIDLVLPSGPYICSFELGDGGRKMKKLVVVR